MGTQGLVQHVVVQAEKKLEMILEIAQGDQAKSPRSQLISLHLPAYDSMHVPQGYIEQPNLQHPGEPEKNEITAGAQN